MRYVVSLSGGLSSAVAADRVIQHYGAENVTLWTANTLWEDEDLWRFHADCAARWGIEPIVHTEGRTPLEVAEDEHVIPNQKLAPCSKRLKIIPFTNWLKEQPKPVTVYIGMDWWEGDRKAAPRRAYEAIEGVSVDFPLDWKPLELRPYNDVILSWGITPPRLYGYGFSHNNCAGSCVRQGASEWRRLLITNPQRFAEVEKWEQQQRAKGPPWSEYAIAKRERHRPDGKRDTFPMTLREIRERYEDRLDVQPEMFGEIDDRTNCFCQTPEDFEAALA